MIEKEVSGKGEKEGRGRDFLENETPPYFFGRGRNRGRGERKRQNLGWEEIENKWKCHHFIRSATQFVVLFHSLIPRLSSFQFGLHFWCCNVKVKIPCKLKVLLGLSEHRESLIALSQPAYVGVAMWAKHREKSSFRYFKPEFLFCFSISLLFFFLLLSLFFSFSSLTLSLSQLIISDSS